MKVLMVEPGYAPYEKEIDGLSEMQAAVGGLIQPIYPFKEPVAVVANDEGILMGLPFNRSVPGGYGGVFGNFFVCGIEEDRFCSLSKEQIQTYKKYFHSAEIPIRAEGNNVVTLKIHPKIKSSKERPGHDRNKPPERG